VARFTSAYSSYVERSDEVLILVRKASQIERSKEAFHRGREIDALCRGSIVLLSSHLEAYVKELGECLLDALFKKAVCRSKLHKPFFYHASRQALDRIRKDTEPQKISEGVFDVVGSESPSGLLKDRCRGRSTPSNSTRDFRTQKSTKFKIISRGLVISRCATI
jgi:hypothetical protein